MTVLRNQLVEVALLWEKTCGIAPSITHTISEFDAAGLVGMPPKQYAAYMKGRSAVARGHDFEWQGMRYQVKANRPSGRKGSFVTLVGKPSNLEWDSLIWILYDTRYQLQEAWLWSRDDFGQRLHHKKRLSPNDLRLGERLDVPQPA